jgi:hypothetical protein
MKNQNEKKNAKKESTEAKVCFNVDIVVFFFGFRYPNQQKKIDFSFSIDSVE